MADTITPLFWFWLLEHSEQAAFSIVDQYDETAVYADVDPHRDPGVWKCIQHLQTACYIADFCVLILRDINTDEVIGWIQILLERGYPRVSDCSEGIVYDLVKDAMDMSDAVNCGRLCMFDVTCGDINPTNIKSYLENSNV
ncbi:MAG: hypothetical protein CMA63_06125 [Euryarchaeota archaeon]|jgi:hypothetical protein|nr:hypothetical protein [Euryarchaeota archaeon]|tara:strand:+ start:1913 stop:2335 length:423 start_codon:yes stop_codon:yes gene_type:complete